MYRNPFCNFTLAGVSLTDYGLKIPSPFSSLELTNSEITSFTSWTLRVTVGGSDRDKINIAAFEALLYSAAQDANGYENSSGIPVSFIFGWLKQYEVTGYASVAVQANMPVLNIPEVCGIVQPSAVAEGLARAIKATTYYDLDIDHDDVPTLVNHGAMTTSFTSYVRGSYTGRDNYDDFPGLLKLSKSYNSSREAGGLQLGIQGKLGVCNLESEN